MNIDIVDFANQILDLADERDHWRAQAKHFEALHLQHMATVNESIKDSEELFGKILTAALDPDSGINRQMRAMARDPLQGAQS